MSPSDQGSLPLDLTPSHTPILGSLPRPIAGVDEAGRGCLAGPVVAAAVILPDTYDLPGLTDSKKLTAPKRFGLESRIKSQAVAWTVGCSWPRVIERINILQATLRAMERAVNILKVKPAALAVDGNQAMNSALPQKTVIDGDSLVPVISAASILAKTFRDRLMATFDRRYPGYGFAKHKGYGTAQHRKAIQEFGPCTLHRMTFKGVKGVTPGTGPDTVAPWQNT
ncbi:MAG: ribonuclease HII [Desulfovibrio sp.]|nr:MAG: ribonuclease HII [Desulfovibrio sp.]